MNDRQEQVLAAARTFVTDIFTHKVDPKFVFHSMDHTEDVAEASSRMSEHYKLSEEDHFVLMLAAWFHDTGYSLGFAAGHEEESVRIAMGFLHEHNVDEAIIQRVGSAIRATRMPQSPVTILEQILCDADLYHLSTDDFKARNQLLKQEQEALLGQKISKKEWRKSNVEFLTRHQYFTDFGKKVLEPKKMENIQLLTHKKDMKKEDVQAAEEAEMFPYVYETGIFNKAKTEADIKAQQKNTERGIQTMFRTTSSNHFELSSLADGKGNIMISVNSIILSIALTLLLARLAFYPEFIIPTVILIAVCLSSIVFAILATRPSVNKGRFTEEDIRSKKTNLLFFGNFHKMQLEEYQWAMNEMLKDSEYLYNSMIKDIYFLGVVLARKYRFLRISYTIFMWGLIVAVIAFAVAATWGSALGGGSAPATMIDY